MAQEISEDPQTNARYLIAPNLRTANQLLRLVCDNFGVKTSRSYAGSLQNLEQFLVRQAKESRFPLILIDEVSFRKKSLSLVVIPAPI